MIIFPAIDIKGGKCVRLLKGDFNKITQYKKKNAILKIGNIEKKVGRVQTAK